MAEALILELEGVGRADYDAVNEVLGIDMGSGAGDWPPGLLVPPPARRRTAGRSWRFGSLRRRKSGS